MRFVCPSQCLVDWRVMVGVLVAARARRMRVVVGVTQDGSGGRRGMQPQSQSGLSGARLAKQAKASKAYVVLLRDKGERERRGRNNGSIDQDGRREFVGSC